MVPKVTSVVRRLSINNAYDSDRKNTHGTISVEMSTHNCASLATASLTPNARIKKLMPKGVNAIRAHSHPTRRNVCVLKINSRITEALSRIKEMATN